MIDFLNVDDPIRGRILVVYVLFKESIIKNKEINYYY